MTTCSFLFPYSNFFPKKRLKEFGRITPGGIPSPDTNPLPTAVAQWCFLPFYLSSELAFDSLSRLLSYSTVIQRLMQNKNTARIMCVSAGWEAHRRQGTHAKAQKPTGHTVTKGFPISRQFAPFASVLVVGISDSREMLNLEQSKV